MFDVSARVAPDRTVTPAVLLTSFSGEVARGDVMARKHTQRLTTAEFIDRACETHDDRYDYSQSVYKNARTKIDIICPVHGPFSLYPLNHLRGTGCRKCANIGKRVTQKEYLSRCADVHGDRYDYSRVRYTTMDRDVSIICREHGVFEQLAREHVRGAGCPKCSGNAPLTQADFLDRASAVHGQRYDYSLAQFDGISHKVSIRCLEHGVFEQRAGHHLDGNRCPKCAAKSMSELRIARAADEALDKFRAIHGDRYDFSLFRYADYYTKGKVVCSEHGVFMASPDSLMRGYGCHECGRKTAIEKTRLGKDRWVEKFLAVHGDWYDYSLADEIVSTKKIVIRCKEHGVFEMFPHHHAEGKKCPQCTIYGPDTRETAIRKFIKVHGDRYDYSRVEYAGTSVKVAIRCDKHGEFMQAPGSHIQGNGCPKCGVESRLEKPTKSFSAAEHEVRDYVRSLGVDTTHGFLPGSDNKWTFDVIAPDERIAIEYNGVYWHSYPRAHRGQHYYKRKHAEDSGYRLITVWEDDWIYKRERMEGLIRRAFLGPVNRIGARETDLVPVDLAFAAQFHEAHHVQLFQVKAAVNHYGLTYRGRVVAVASFDNAGVLHRYTVVEGFSITGGLSKLVKAFRREHGNLPIVTYCDRDYFTGDVYHAAGFSKNGAKLTMSYVMGLLRHRRERFMKKKLSGLFGDVDMSKREIDLCAENGVYACWNSGTEKFVLPAAKS